MAHLLAISIIRLPKYRFKDSSLAFWLLPCWFLEPDTGQNVTINFDELKTLSERVKVHR